MGNADLSLSRSDVTFAKSHGEYLTIGDLVRTTIRQLMSEIGDPDTSGTQTEDRA